MTRLFRTALLGAAIIAPIALGPTSLHADDQDHDRDRDRVYHDRDHNDDHRWNDDEDRAYRTWVRETHRQYHEFSKLKEEEQRRYWAWRHEHEHHDAF